MFYLLSEFDDQILELYTADTYLEWAADVFELRVNPDLHEDERGKEESQMLGVYFLYFEDLLIKLKEKELTEKLQTIQSLWDKMMDRVHRGADSYAAAITEHFYCLLYTSRFMRLILSQTARVMCSLIPTPFTPA